jgi:hypothetical protein
LSDDDRRFRADFEACAILPAAFDHRAHVRLAYTYLAEADDEAAVDRMRAALLAFLLHNGVDPSKYHETMTRAWVLAVRHFMAKSPVCESADAFIASNPTLLDTKIMLKPRPVPLSCCLVVKKGSKILFRDSAAMPVPESLSSTSV